MLAVTVTYGSFTCYVWRSVCLYYVGDVWFVHLVFVKYCDCDIWFVHLVRYCKCVSKLCRWRMLRSSSCVQILWRLRIFRSFSYVRQVCIISASHDISLEIQLLTAPLLWSNSARVGRYYRLLLDELRRSASFDINHNSTTVNWR